MQSARIGGVPALDPARDGHLAPGGVRPELVAARRLAVEGPASGAEATLHLRFVRRPRRRAPTGRRPGARSAVPKSGSGGRPHPRHRSRPVGARWLRQADVDYATCRQDVRAGHCCRGTGVATYTTCRTAWPRSKRWTSIGYSCCSATTWSQPALSPPAPRQQRMFAKLANPRLWLDVRPLLPADPAVTPTVEAQSFRWVFVDLVDRLQGEPWPRTAAMKVRFGIECETVAGARSRGRSKVDRCGSIGRNHVSRIETSVTLPGCTSSMAAATTSTLVRILDQFVSSSTTIPIRRPARFCW